MGMLHVIKSEHRRLFFNSVRQVIKGLVIIHAYIEGVGGGGGGGREKHVGKIISPLICSTK